jgi:hypothetical protein
MSFFSKLLRIFGTDMLEISLIAEEQDEGYLFLYSPQLKGFTLMLAPEQTKNIAALMNALHDPFMAYMTTLYKAKHDARAKALKMKDFGERQAHSYVARLSFC